MKIFKAFKTELKPNKKQVTLFRKAAGCARFAYNWSLALRQKEYAETGKSGNMFSHSKILNLIKDKEFPWMQESSKCAPQQALKDLDKAFQNFFKGCKNGTKIGFPKPKSKHRDKAKLRFNVVVNIKENKINLPRIGWVRLKEKDYLPKKGTVKQLSCTVKESTKGRWFVSVACEIEVPDCKQSLQSVRQVGIDVGLKTFAVTSDQDFFEHPKFLKKSERKLKIAQRKVSKKVKGSNNRKNAVQKLGKVHFKIGNQRKDFLNKLTTSLVKTKPDVIFVVEGLSIKHMVKNHKLAKSISDSGWYEFTRQLKYKTLWAYGEERVFVADRFFPSSKTCSCCGVVKEDLKLSDRIFRCGSCDLIMDRDLNAAKNLSKVILF